MADRYCNTKLSTRKFSIRHSITAQICLIIIGLVTGTVLLCWFLNTTFLDDYYGMMKTGQLVSGYKTVNHAAEQGQLEKSDFSVELDRLCARGNIELLIMSSDGHVVWSSSNDSMNMINRFMDVLFGAQLDEQRKVVTRTDSYSVERVTDQRMGAQFLALWGTLDDGHLIMMRTALEGIRESVLIANRFLAYIGMCAVILSAVIVFFVTSRITKPIRRLTDISRQMTELDFTAKYEAEGGSVNEIDLLGQHMNQLSQTLEQAISELKTANNELQIDIRRKDEIDEMRKEFLSNVSHELKTPLALIQGYAEGLQECINDDEESRSFYCEVIMDEAEKMNRMVQKLLTLNHLEFGTDPIQMERFDISELIHGVIGSTTLMLSQNDLSVEFDEPQTYVWGDEFQVEEVLTNYLSNAIHHCENEKKIRIYYTEKEEVLRISVFNTGHQIPEDDLEKVWIKFYKVDKARTREYGGSGIGLSIVKAIMDSHHRACGVCNHEDGVEFWLELDKIAVANIDKR